MKKLIIDGLVKLTAGILLTGALTFIPAGTLHFWQGWVLLGTLFMNGEYSVEKVDVTLIRKEESQGGWMVGIYVADDVPVKLDPVQSADPE